MIKKKKEKKQARVLIRNIITEYINECISLLEDEEKVMWIPLFVKEGKDISIDGI